MEKDGVEAAAPNNPPPDKEVVAVKLAALLPNPPNDDVKDGVEAAETAEEELLMPNG